MNAPWVLFEAGALSKGLTKNLVCPLLVNFSHTDLKPPLSQFNGVLPNKDEVLKLIKTVNAQNGDKALSDDKVEKAFGKWWEDFDTKFKAILSTYKPSKEQHKRSTDDMIAETLEIVRSLQKGVQTGSIPSSSSDGWPGSFSASAPPHLVDTLTGLGPDDIHTAFTRGFGFGRRTRKPKTSDGNTENPPQPDP